MKALLPIIQTLRTALAEGSVNPAVERAAAEYARCCSEAAQRLEQVAAMLAKGSDYQALQASEQEPPLLDLAAALSFGGEKPWQAFCESHDLPVAPLLDAKTVQLIEGLYAKGVTANHPLYKDLRAASLSRDDAKALRIIRTILKLNPADENAKSELLRLENKRFQEVLEKLRAALKSDDEETIAELTESLSELASQEKLSRLDAFQQGEAVRRGLRRRQALEDLPPLVEEMKSRRAEQDWKALGPLLEKADSLIQSNAIDPAMEAWAQDLEEVRGFHRREVEADAKQRRFERCIQLFVAFAEEIETRLMTGSGVTFDEIASKDEEFVRRWKEMEAFQLAVPPDTLQRLRNAGQELRAKLERMLRAKRLRVMAVAAAGVVLLMGVAGVGLHAWKAYSLANELGQYQQTGKCLPAEELVRKLRSQEGLLLRWPYLQAKVEEVDSWAKLSRSTETQASQALEILESSFDQGASSLAPAQLAKQLTDAESLVKQLVADLSVEPSNRLAALKTKSELHYADLMKERSETAGQLVTKLEREVAEMLSFEKKVALSAPSLVTLNGQLMPVEEGLNPEVEALRLPADLETRILRLRQKMKAFQQQLETFERVRAETAAAQTFEAYRQALLGWQELPFAEAAPALKMLDKLPTEAAFLAALLTGGDDAALQAISEDSSGPHMMPNEPMERDLKFLLALREDEYLNNVWEHALVDHAQGKALGTFWSAGPLSRTTPDSYSTKWSGRCYLPSTSPSGVAFVERSFQKSSLNDPRFGSARSGQDVTVSRLAPTSSFVSRLRLERMTDPDGERFLRSLLDVFDQIVKDQDEGVSPMAKAYLMIRLEELARPRSFAWGLHLCRSLQADLRELHMLLGDTALRSEDWLMSSPKTKLAQDLGGFFKKCAGRSYLKEATARRGLLRGVAQAGLQFGGYIETDRLLKLNNAALASGELWAIHQESGLPFRFELKGDGETAKSQVLAEAQPLSPLFFSPVDRKKLLQEFEAALSGTGVDVVPLPGDALFITQP